MSRRLNGEKEDAYQQWVKIEEANDPSRKKGRGRLRGAYRPVRRLGLAKRRHSSAKR
jgi:hypothetical protein